VTFAQTPERRRGGLDTGIPEGQHPVVASPMTNTDLAAQRALDRLRQVGFEALTESERILAAVWTFESQVMNQGLAHYFARAPDALVRFAPVAFRSIGAQEFADLAEAAYRIFGDAGLSGDRPARRQQVRALSAEARMALTGLENRLYASAEDPDELLEAYLNRP